MTSSPLQNVKFAQKILRFTCKSIQQSIRYSHVSATFHEATYQFGAIDFAVDGAFVADENANRSTSSPDTSPIRRAQSPTTISSHPSGKLSSSLARQTIRFPSFLIDLCNKFIRKGVCYSVLNSILEGALRCNTKNQKTASAVHIKNQRSDEVAKAFLQISSKTPSQTLLSNAVLCTTKNLETSIRFVIEQAHRFRMLRDVLDAETVAMHTPSTPLVLLLKENNRQDLIGAVKLLIDAGYRFCKYERELLSACLIERYNLDVAKLLIESRYLENINKMEQKIDVKSVVDSSHMLVNLAFQGKLKAIEFLVQYTDDSFDFLDMDVHDSFGFTVCHAAVFSGMRSSAILKFLCKHGAKVNAKTSGQQQQKKTQNSPERNNNNNNNSKCKERWFTAMSKNRVSFLHSETEPPSGLTALHLLANPFITSHSVNARIEIMKTLLELGADPNLKDDVFGDTPLDCAKLSNDSMEVIKFLEGVTTK